MASNTTRLGLLKKDTVVDGFNTLNIKTMLNENWDKIDLNVETITGAEGKIATAKSEAISTASTDATNKANTAETNAKNASIPTSQKGAANGVATLDASSRVPAIQLKNAMSKSAVIRRTTASGVIYTQSPASSYSSGYNSTTPFGQSMSLFGADRYHKVTSWNWNLNCSSSTGYATPWYQINGGGKIYLPNVNMPNTAAYYPVGGSVSIEGSTITVGLDAYTTQSNTTWQWDSGQIVGTSYDRYTITEE